MKRNLLSILLIFFGTFLLHAQVTIKGIVKDSSNEPLPGANVLEKGTKNGTTTDFNGVFSIEVPEKATLIISFSGFETQEIVINKQTELDIVLQDIELDEVVVVGTRNVNRSAVDTPVAIDVIDVADVTAKAGKIEINQLLQYAAPSFNATKQSGSDGADHIDPATIRGLGPDQTLVLINGKRRHQSSLINLFGTRGRGNTGTDLNAIPASAIKRIEILRDGAAAQYGSDAIAGVVNIVLKDEDYIGKFEGGVSYGMYNTNADVDVSPFTDGNYGVWNTNGFRLDTEKDGNVIGDDQSFDGNSLKATANYGVKIGEKGFAHFTTEFLNKEKTLRPSFEFRKGFGEASIKGYNLFTNMSFPLFKNTEMYVFGGRNYRDTDAYAFTRNEGPRVVTSIYPNGFTPRITSEIEDNSIAVGLKIKTFDNWIFDISNTYGYNNFHYFVEGSLNATLEENSPTSFDAGGHRLAQNTLNIEMSKFYDDFLAGLNIAYGFEVRGERFEIFSGEEASWGTYTENGTLITNNTQEPARDENGEIRPGGSQGFPGYSPDNVVDEGRSNISLFADFELDITKKFLVGLAARYENYSDFGGTLNGKLSTRLKLNDNFNIRGSISTGFRAPSLAQLHYNLKFSDFLGGVSSDKLLSSNTSPITRTFGVGPLKEETSINTALGFTGKFDNFTVTFDGYFVDVDDRIVLTGNFPTNDIPEVSDVQFFVNGVNTQTKGIDIIVTYDYDLGASGKLGINFAANFNDMVISHVNNGNLDEEIFFGDRDKYFLLASAPSSKINLNLNYQYKKFDANLAFTRFSEIELIDSQIFEDTLDYGTYDDKKEAATDYYGAKIVTDLNLSYKATDNVRFTLGSNNLFNIYPDQQDDWTESGGYFDAVQMGFSGAYYYARLNVNF
ncbi:TonB-dependent receptor [Tenacibaculum geojense]|uniref:TonB-dependent receptor domain-containing protein n=1 Tax=Tenacibaculum geojense TaxID=915352 RepID=A0ABW3JMU8_9FLAO